MQGLVVAMMISFPIQGYGLYSIIFSTLHTLAVLVFIISFFRLTKGQSNVSLWFARAALIFFFISTAGPFSLGYLMSNGLGQSVWYNFSIYFYLHFQYNGFFLFGAFSLFYQLLERKNISFDIKKSLRFGKWMAAGCIPAYSLSILFAKPGLIFNLIGAASGIVQLLAVAYFFREILSLRNSLKSGFHPVSFFLLRIILFAWVLKSLLQLGSAHPYVAQLAFEMRPVVIAYLHLVLVGIITLFLLTWYHEMKWVQESVAKLSIILLLMGFVASELCLVLVPWWSSVIGQDFPYPVAVFVFSCFMVMGSLLFYFAFWLKQNIVSRLDFRSGVNVGRSDPRAFKDL